MTSSKEPNVIPLHTVGVYTACDRGEWYADHIRKAAHKHHSDGGKSRRRAGVGLNVSAISDAAVAEAVRAARATAWAADNAAAISERRAWIEAHGMPLADLQVLRLV